MNNNKIKRYAEIHKEFFGSSSTFKPENISDAEVYAAKAFMEGKETEEGLRKLFENIKLFNS